MSNLINATGTVSRPMSPRLALRCKLGGPNAVHPKYLEATFLLRSYLTPGGRYPYWPFPTWAHVFKLPWLETQVEQGRVDAILDAVTACDDASQQGAS